MRGAAIIIFSIHFRVKQGIALSILDILHDAIPRLASYRTKESDHSVPEVTEIGVIIVVTINIQL